MNNNDADIDDHDNNDDGNDNTNNINNNNDKITRLGPRARTSSPSSS